MLSINAGKFTMFGGLVGQRGQKKVMQKGARKRGGRG